MHTLWKRTLYCV